MCQENRVNSYKYVNNHDFGVIRLTFNFVSGIIYV